jgi:GNAT superfamily N-acetyltransferase
MTDKLQVRQGVVGDKRTIIGLIDEAADWLRTKNTDQWDKPWPSRRARDERVERGLRRGNTWIVEAESRPIATVTYRRHGNQGLWTKSEDDEPAVYVSRLIVSRACAGLGIGAALVDWAAARAVTDWHARWIRIDVWTSNTALHEYYEKRGFRYLRTCPYDPKFYPSAALFQKSTEEIDVAAASQFEEAASVPDGILVPQA